LLCNNLINRKLPRVEIRDQPFEKAYLDKIRMEVQGEGIPEKDLGYFVYADQISNYAYNPGNEQIQILYPDGVLRDIAEASDLLDVSVLSKTFRKYFLYSPKYLHLSANQ
jgi:hypothetical protein